MEAVTRLPAGWPLQSQLPPTTVKSQGFPIRITKAVLPRVSCPLSARELGTPRPLPKRLPVHCSSSSPSVGEQGTAAADSATRAADVASQSPDVEDTAVTTRSLPTGASAGPVGNRFWSWRGFNIRYQAAGTEGPALLLVHGFGANCDHWRKNIGPLAESHRVFAIDLLGYGYSSKPDPREPNPLFPLSSPYRFETWGEQINDFISEVVGGPAFVATNSVGGIAGLQAAILNPALSRGVLLLNVSLRMLHVSKQAWYARPAVSALQSVLANTDLGKTFFKSVATPRAVGNILKECYGDAGAVTEELVEVILKPGLEPGAVDVFLDFICYSGGPLPEELIPQVQCPVAIGWGEADPWEPLKLGRAFADLDNVEDFTVFLGVGHCPQDEAPHLVNPYITSFVARFS